MSKEALSVEDTLKLALEALEKLWNIIDDIDTYGDMAKGDEKLYRALVERRQRTRFEETGISTDGYELTGGAITAIKEALMSVPDGVQPDPYKQGYADAMNWKIQNHLEHLPVAQPEQRSKEHLALEAYMKAGIGNSTDFVLQGAAYDLAVEALAQPKYEPVEDLQAKLKWATEQLEANINWEFVAAAKEEMLKAAWAEIKELREQIKEPEQEPVAIVHRNEYNEYRLEPHDNFDIKSIPSNIDVPLFKSPQCKPLTRAVLWKLWCDAKFESAGFFWLVFARAIEAAHGIRPTDFKE